MFRCKKYIIAQSTIYFSYYNCFIICLSNLNDKNYLNIDACTNILNENAENIHDATKCRIEKGFYL